MVSGDPSLMVLVEAIAAHDRSGLERLLVATPELVAARAPVRATRGEPEPYLDSIQHYVYGGDTALHIAAAAYEPAMIRALMAHGAVVAATNRRGAQPLHYAADGTPGSPAWNPTAQAETVATLIEAGADPNATDKSGVAPLHRAIRTRCADAVRALLNGGADPRLPNGSGSSPAQLAAVTSGRGGSGSDDAKAQQLVILDLLQRHGAT
jgi:ankyrin repeat protein